MSRKNPLQNCFTREEFAKSINRTPKTLDRWQLNGLGPPRIEVGNLVLYRKETVERWLAENERGESGQRPK